MRTRERVRIFLKIFSKHPMKPSTATLYERKAGERMNPEIIAQYVERIYAYAVKRTWTEDEAEDLSQEILLTALRELPRLRREDRFEPWLWSVAANVTRTYRRARGKQRAMFSYDAFPEDIPDEDQGSDACGYSEEYAALRRKIAMLSAMYRDIIVLHYYDGLSTKAISERLNIPEGTVTWRLSEARRKLKKESVDMNESALHPKTLKIDIFGNGDFDGNKIPFPSVYISDALSQNILCYCYDEPRTIEEIAGHCGVPAYYIEDSVRNLLAHEAVIEPARGKYRTDFIIWSDEYGIYSEQYALPTMLPMMDKLITAWKGIAADAAELDFYRADKSEDELIYLYGVLAWDIFRTRHCTLIAPAIPPRRDGFRWRYIASRESGAHPRLRLPSNQCCNDGSRGSYASTCWFRFCGFPYRPLMYDFEINACEDILTGNAPQNENEAAQAIQRGYIVRRDDGTLFVTVPAMTREQKVAFDEIAERHLAPLADEYNAAVLSYVEGYKKLFPRHLQDDAARFCRGTFGAMFRIVAEYAVEQGIVKQPPKETYCDVLIQNAPK